MASFNSQTISHIHHELHSHLPSEPALRGQALGLLPPKNLIDPAAVDAWIEMYRDEIGPKRGKDVEIVARAWREPGFQGTSPGRWDRGDWRTGLCRSRDRPSAGRRKHSGSP